MYCSGRATKRRSDRGRAGFGRGCPDRDGQRAAATVAAVDAGGFVGELNLLTGQNVYLLCRVREAGMVYRVTPRACGAHGQRRRTV
jgi:hypothetical protein